MKIDILVCTFQRPEIRAALESVRAADVPVGCDVGIVVVDNDDTPSAWPGIRDIIENPDGKIRYLHVPGRNISLARNGCLAASAADWIVFIDDDEVVAQDWLVQLWQRRTETGVDGIFGVVKSVFPADSPAWMRELNLHSPAPQRTRGTVRSGGAGNVLLRWAGTPWFGERFDVARGKSGGEDTEFFHRLGRMGATYEIAPEAIAHEPVTPERLRMAWLVKRRFRSGQSHASSASGVGERMGLTLRAAAKATGSYATVLPTLIDKTKWRYWFLRGVFHSGVVAGCINLRETDGYGEPAEPGQ